MTINDLHLPVNVELRDFHVLSKEGIAIGLEEPLLQFDPIKEDLSIEPSSLFYKGVYDSSSTSRPFGAIKPFVILPTTTKRNMDQLLGWIANGKTYFDRNGRQKTEFVGLNHKWSRFNCGFILPRDGEYFYADKEEDFFWRALNQ